MLGQKQGSVGGGFQADQSFKGMLSNVNLWNRVLLASQIEEISTSCLLDPWNAGNVYKWHNFLRASETRLLKKSTCEPLLAGRLNNTLARFHLYSNQLGLSQSFNMGLRGGEWGCRDEGVAGESARL